MDEENTRKKEKRELFSIDSIATTNERMNEPVGTPNREKEWTHNKKRIIYFVTTIESTNWIELNWIVDNEPVDKSPTCSIRIGRYVETDYRLSLIDFYEFGRIVFCCGGAALSLFGSKCFNKFIVSFQKTMNVRHFQTPWKLGLCLYLFRRTCLSGVYSE